MNVYVYYEFDTDGCRNITRVTSFIDTIKADEDDYYEFELQEKP